MSDAIEVVAEVIEPASELEVTCTQAAIKDNLSAIGAYVDKQLEPYVGTVIDPSDNRQVSEGRDCMADLNKLKAPIDAERRRIKREYEAPLKAFEARVKDITGKIDAARDAIKAQVDAADEAFRDNRRAVLEAEFAGCAGPLEGILSFERVLDKAWLNRSTAEAKALKGVQDAVIDTIGKYEVLTGSNLAHKDECVKLFCETLDLKAALALDGQLAEKEREAAEFAARRAAAEAAVRREPAVEEPPSQPCPAQPSQVHRWLLHLEFNATKETAVALSDAVKGLGITGGTIKDMGVVSDD